MQHWPDKNIVFEPVFLSAYNNIITYVVSKTDAMKPRELHLPLETVTISGS